MNEKTLKEFLYAYVDKMVELMADGQLSLNAMMINCTACPFCELCHNDDDESGLPCERYILNRLTDGNKYRAN